MEKDAKNANTSKHKGWGGTPKAEWNFKGNRWKESNWQSVRLACYYAGETGALCLVDDRVHGRALWCTAPATDENCNESCDDEDEGETQADGDNEDDEQGDLVGRRAA